MKTLLLLVLSAGVLAYSLAPQWRSFEQMGERRFRALSGVPKEILVGVSWPFSANQDGLANGVQLALDEINDNGLSGGIPIRLVWHDDGGDWNRARNVAVDFCANPKMSAVLGSYESGKAIKTSPMYEASRLLHMVVGANATPMTTHGFQYLVRTVVSNQNIARSLARMTVARGRRKIAVIWEEDAYGKDLAYQYHVSLDNLDAQVVYQWSYSRNAADFRLPVNELKGVDADMIFLAGLEPWAGDFVRMVRAVGIKTEIVGAFTDTPQMRAHAGAAREGAMYFDEYNVNSPSPQNQAFVQKFRARYGKAPDTWAAQGYDALHILAKAVKATHSANPLDLSYAIRFMSPWEGVTGPYKFDSQGELEDKPIFLDVYQNGVPVTIQPIAIEEKPPALQSPAITIPLSR